jgi:hypothetical protein
LSVFCRSLAVPISDLPKSYALFTPKIELKPIEEILESSIYKVPVALLELIKITESQLIEEASKPRLRARASKKKYSYEIHEDDIILPKDDVSNEDRGSDSDWGGSDSDSSDSDKIGPDPDLTIDLSFGKSKKPRPNSKKIQKRVRTKYVCNEYLCLCDLYRDRDTQAEHNLVFETVIRLAVRDTMPATSVPQNQNLTVGKVTLGT